MQLCLRLLHFILFPVHCVFPLFAMQANPNLLHGYLDVFQSYFNLWNVFMIPSLEQHLTNIVRNVYRGGPPFGFPF